ncbi:peptidase S28 family protein [Cavenderia fasciculata]|uniref:Peptidase S28 family protein n=1 Tax=Cavenderia fasciculata TaxID=261658 RepID=F4PWP9_CACFS|nr:peptidase S28 family protein [Cavenderia fasciculata]EGG20413.1 peptidase S28 family protein [Cavenderia fasciculata]|eukprot:XP_004367396.1 peptidase S28 family protein [Cavenderia fasciculata]
MNIKKSLLVTLGLLLLVTVCLGGRTFKNLNQNNNNNVKDSSSFPIYWYNQTLNHFDAQDSRTFMQRYYTNDAYYDYSKGGPIILYINGEGPVSSPPYQQGDGVVVYAQALGAYIVTLEHRYYGDSSPFEDLSTENLKFLSSRQALNDLAVFISDFRKNLSLSTEVVTIGGSYSGALSAWFRVKYPHITVGSVSSSGVVNAILDFTAFDEWVAYAAGDECATAMRQVTQEVEQAYFGGQADEIRQIFNAETLVEDGDFFFWLADSNAEGIQYGYHSQLCDPLVDAMNNGTSLIKTYALYTANVWTGSLGTPAEYATAWQQNTTHDINNSADRLWLYQTCTEFGYWQNAPAENSIRSSIVNMTYWRDHCEQVFGIALWPDVEATNEYYGGNQTAGTNIIFVNSSQDPWSRASIITQQYPSEPVAMVTCGNCGHCSDIRVDCPGGCDTPNNLAQVRQVTLQAIQSWLAQ